MSSGSGWHTKQSTGNIQYNDSGGWGTANPSVSLSSPISHPDSWPQLGAGPEPTPKPDPRQGQEISDNMQQRPEPTGWDTPSTGTSSETGWGMPSQQSTGWGGAMNNTGNNWGRQPQVDNGTALWGKQGQSGSGWSGPPSTQAPAATSWNTGPLPANPSSGLDLPASSNTTQHQDEHATPAQSSSNAPPSQPESWAAAAAVTPAQSLSGSSHSPTSSAPQSGGAEAATSQEQPFTQHDQNEPDDAPAKVDPNEQLQKLVDSHEGWGKRPIQQNSSWEAADPQATYAAPRASKIGTEAWCKAPPVNSGSGWQAPPEPSPQQQWSQPAANPPTRGWGAGPSQPPMQPRVPWSGAQPTNPTSQTGWGDPRLPSPANPINRWNTPTNPMSNPPNQGWGASGAQPTNWNISAASSDNSSWGGNVQRGSHPSNWGVPPSRPDGSWNQVPNMQRHPSVVDDGTSAWGDPTAYKNVNMWDKKGSVGPNMGAGDPGQNKSEPTGWGTPSTPQGMNNKPSPTGWGDVNLNKPVDDGTSWTKISQGGSNWNQGQGWGIGKPEGSNGWGGNSEQASAQWGQLDNDPSRTKSRDYRFVDRKTSTGSDNVFEDNQLDRGGTGSGADMAGGVNYGQFPIVPGNNSAMPGLNNPRPMAPQGLMGLQGQSRQAPPPQIPAQFQNQIQQIRHAIMKGVIPPHVLNPQLMTPQHLNQLQQLIMKTTEFQQLSARMNMLNKPNAPPHLRSQQEQIVRVLRQLQQQIQTLQQMLSQKSLQKPPPLHDKGFMGALGPNPGLGLDVPPGPGNMPPGNSMVSPFNMSSISQRLPSTGGNPVNREQLSRLHAWRRPSAGFDNFPDSATLGPGIPPSISDMIGGSGLLNSSAKQGGLLGLQQADSRMQGADQSYEANGLPGNMDAMKNSNDMAHIAGPDQAASNLKNILADVGPPEFIPGKKWAGFRPIDPESDPDITPGSVAYAKTMSVNTVKDADQVLNRERQTMSQPDVTNLNTIDVTAKIQPALASSFANISIDDTSKTTPATWSTAPRWQENGRSWLVLSNISPNMDFTTLRNLCSMNRRVSSFHPNCPMRGTALAKYQTSEDAAFTCSKLAESFAGTNMLTANVVSDQEVSSFLGTGNNWNPGSSGRQLFGSNNAPHAQHPQVPSGGFGGGPPVMPNPDMPYGGEAQSPWSTGDGGMSAPHAASSWSTGANHGPGRPMNMWSNGLYDNSRVMSPHNLLPENLLGEHTM